MWRRVVPIRATNLSGTALGSKDDALMTLVGQAFDVIDHTSDGKPIIRIVDYRARYGLFRKKSKYRKVYNVDEKTKKPLYFVLENALLDSVAKPYVSPFVGGGLAVGIISFPFKIRPQQKGDFSGAFNFGAAGGYKFRHRVNSPWTYSILSGYSISNIVLDSVSTTKNQKKLSSTNNFTALSLSLGFLFEYQKVQIGVFTGWDFLPKMNQMEFDWNYQRKPWFSVGIGYSIFSPQAASDKTTPTKQQE